jgi:hypothetical protein
LLGDLQTARPLPPIANPPWSRAIGGGLINKTNAAAYVAALKQYVSANARQLILDYQNWDAAKARWYNEPWLGSIRESIHGAYSANQFGPEVFPGTGLTTTFDTYALTYYDERAAHSLYKVWKAEANNPDIKTENFQFDEGSVIVKAAVFVSDDPNHQTDWWPVIKGAAEWPLYLAIPESQPGPRAAPSTASTGRARNQSRASFRTGGGRPWQAAPRRTTTASKRSRRPTSARI